MKKKLLFIPLALLGLASCDFTLPENSQGEISLISVNEESSLPTSVEDDSTTSATQTSTASTQTSATSTSVNTAPTSTHISTNSEESSAPTTDPDADYDESKNTIITLLDNGSSVSNNNGYVVVEGNDIYITKAGVYDISGTLTNGKIIVNPSDEDVVEINLNGVDISCDYGAPIGIFNGDKTEISVKKGTTNYIKDLRTSDSDTTDDSNSAIYSTVDLKIKGAGTLEVESSYNNGIGTKDDLTIQKATIKVTARNNAIKGNDSITIKSGDLTVISTGGDGLKTTSSDVSSKGNQRGNIDILGGTINIYSACDGIDAAYNVNIANTKETDSTLIPSLNIITNKYSEYTAEIVSSSTETMYLRTSSYYSSYRFACYFYGDSSSTGTWVDSEYIGQQSSGGGWGGSRYYYYSLERPTDLENVKIYAFSASQSENSTTNYVAVSNGQTINENYDTAAISISGSSISISRWTNYQSSQGSQGGWGGPGGMDEKNTDKADVSAKGIKAANIINIDGGNTYIKAYDDGIHANYGETLENGEKGVGDLIVTGGTTTVYASDDAFHADRYLRIQGGVNTVKYSYEGFEGNQIYISGGTNNVYAKDDAINAGNNEQSAGLSPTINVSGGYTFAAVPTSGDTDCIDSNGTYVQTGGVVIACGKNTNTAAALDTDGSVTLSGGSLLLFGSSEKTPTCNNGVTKSTKSGTYSNNTYVVTYSNGEVIETLKLPSSSYSGLNSYSVNGTVSSVTTK